jgi:hypothetical protein
MSHLLCPSRPQIGNKYYQQPPFLVSQAQAPLCHRSLVRDTQSRLRTSLLLPSWTPRTRRAFPRPSPQSQRATPMGG